MYRTRLALACVFSVALLLSLTETIKLAPRVSAASVTRPNSFSPINFSSAADALAYTRNATQSWRANSTEFRAPQNVPNSAPLAIPGDENWSTDFAPPGLDNLVRSIYLARDGTLYAGGDFLSAGALTVNFVAKWNGTTWSALGNGLYGYPQSITEDDAGNIYAGGNFSMNGFGDGYIAKWDGSTWTALGGGLNGEVMDLYFDSATDILYVGGFFTDAGGDPAADYFAKWDGIEWSSVGGAFDSPIFAVTPGESGEIFVGGFFSSVDQVTGLSHIARWDGAEWHEVGGGLNDFTWDLIYDTTSDILYATGNFADAGGNTDADYVALWDRSAWSALGGGLTALGKSLELDTNGDLYVGGFFEDVNGDPDLDFLIRWDGDWNPVGSRPDYTVFDLAFDDANNTLYAGGGFSQIGEELTAHYIGRWDGEQWHALGTGDGFYGTVNALEFNNNGHVYVGGSFEDVQGNSNADYIMKWDGSQWVALGPGLNGAVYALAFDTTNQILYAGGDFTDAGGSPNADKIAKWDGTSWTALDTGLNTTVRALEVTDDGTLYAGGDFTFSPNNGLFKYIAKWNGTSWQSVETGLNGPVRALLYTNSLLYVGGSFNQTGDNTPLGGSSLARWDGNAWSLVGGGVNGAVYALTLGSGGNLIAGGNFTFTQADTEIRNIARWDGSNWSGFGEGVDAEIFALAVDSGGRVYAGGTFEEAESLPISFIAQWNDYGWNSLGSGTAGPVHALLSNSTALYVGGNFGYSGGSTSSPFNLWTPSSVQNRFVDAASNCGGATPCYDSIQDAINAASIGEIIRISAGTYNESVNLNKNVTLRIRRGATIQVNGSITANVGNVNLKRINTLQVTGNLSTGNAQWNTDSSTVVFNGSGVQTFSGNLTFFNVVINSGAILDLGTNSLQRTGNLVVNGGLSRSNTISSITPFQTAYLNDGYNFVTLGFRPFTQVGTTTMKVTSGVTAPTCGGNSLDGVSVLRYWQITPNIQVSGAVRFIPNFDWNGLSEDEIFVYRCDGAEWNLLDTILSTAIDENNGELYYEVTNIPANGIFALARPSNLVFADSQGACNGKTPCYQGLQNAIDQAAVGSIINVFGEEYNEPIALNRNVILRLARGNAIITEDLAISAGTLRLINYLTLKGDLSYSGGTWSSEPTGTVSFEGNAVQQVTGEIPFGTVIIQSGATLDVGTYSLAYSFGFFNYGVLRQSLPQQEVTGDTPVPFTDALNRTALELASTGENPLGPTTVTIEAGQPPSTCGGQSFSVPAVNRSWNITPSNTTNVQATVRLYFAPEELNGLNLDTLELYNCHNGEWIELTGEPIWGEDTNSGYYYVELENVSTFSPFGIGSPSVPTATTLAALGAKQNKKGVRVKWSTGSELDVIGFNVWRKVGKNEWKQRNGRARAAQYSGQVQGGSYTFLDRKTRTSKTYGYKIEILKTNGKSEWSSILRIETR